MSDKPYDDIADDVSRDWSRDDTDTERVRMYLWGTLQARVGAANELSRIADTLETLTAALIKFDEDPRYD